VEIDSWFNGDFVDNRSDSVVASCCCQKLVAEAGDSLETQGKVKVCC
jgi:hypothetical protein